jgi:hypothetical protein
VYRDRIALEREYAGKLLLLANKAGEKKSRKIAALVLGEEPTKAWGEEDVRNRYGSLPLCDWRSRSSSRAAAPWVARTQNLSIHSPNPRRIM